MVEVSESPAFRALTPSAKRILRQIESEVAAARGSSDARITLPQFGAVRTASRAIQLLVNLGFIQVGTGAKTGSVFWLTGKWRDINAAEAARRKTLPRPRRARWGQTNGGGHGS